MKLVHKSNVIEAKEFDPLCSPWPEGITKVTREGPNHKSVSFEFDDPVSIKSKRWGRVVGAPIKAGDVIVSEFDPESLEELQRYVLPRQMIEEEYLILGEVQTQ